MLTTQTCGNKDIWDEEVLKLGGHPLQLWGWGEVKSAHNWRAERLRITEDDKVVGLAQLLIRKLPAPFRALVYIPRGPVCTEADRDKVLEVVSDYVKQNYKAVALTIEPDWEEANLEKSWKKSLNTVLIPRTIILDLNLSEDELLARMTKKTRQYIRKSGSENISIRSVKSREELAGCLAIYRQTAARAKFAIHDDQYYYDIFDMMGEYTVVMAAYEDEKPLAFLWLVLSQTTAFELYGGMNEEGQRLRANYALKWHAIKTVKKWGLERYDFNGLLNDGVSSFKQGFSDHENQLVGTYDKPLSPLYFVWSKGLPAAKKVVRKLKR